MTFSERMKDLLDQGAQGARDWSEKGYQASKEFLAKAGAKAQDLGERGVLMFEIKQLEGQGEKLMNRLGTETYRLLVEQPGAGVQADSPDIKPILDEVARIRTEIDKREADLKNRQA